MTQMRSTRRPAASVRVLQIRDGVATQRNDSVAGEEPMEIRVAGPGQEPVNVSVTMRTPGHDFELAVGFLYTEGLIGLGDVAAVNYCEVDGEQDYNVVTVRTTRPVTIDTLARNFYATSACGICGAASLEHIRAVTAVAPGGPRVEGSMLGTLPEALRRVQRVFDKTGGLHAAGLFRASGELLCVREDVGRHNAVDKLVGESVLSGALPWSDHIVVVSGRTGFEIVSKVAAGGAPILCSVSAPSALAVTAAEESGMTLVGFLRGRSANVYAGPGRVLV